jgi:hypothetical protein
MFANDDQFYTLLNNIVRLSRNPNPSDLAIRTFAVVHAWTDIQNEQLGKTLSEKEKIYFFSKKWDQQGYPTNDISYEYPLLAVRPGGQNVSDFFNGDARSQGSHQLLLVDKLYLAPPQHPTILTQRNQHQITEDCKDLMIGLFNTLKTVKAYNIGSDLYYLPAGYVDGLLQPTDYVLNHSASVAFKAKLSTIGDFNIEPFWGTGNLLFGVMIANFQIKVDNCTNDIILMGDANKPIL